MLGKYLRVEIRRVISTVAFGWTGGVREKMALFVNTSMCLRTRLEKEGGCFGLFLVVFFSGEVIKTSNSQGPSQSYYTHHGGSLLQARLPSGNRKEGVVRRCTARSRAVKRLRSPSTFQLQIVFFFFFVSFFCGSRGSRRFVCGLPGPDLPLWFTSTSQEHLDGNPSGLAPAFARSTVS